MRGLRYPPACYPAGWPHRQSKAAELTPKLEENQWHIKATLTQPASQLVHVLHWREVAASTQRAGCGDWIAAFQESIADRLQIAPCTGVECACTLSDQRTAREGHVVRGTACATETTHGLAKQWCSTSSITRGKRLIQLLRRVGRRQGCTESSNRVNQPRTEGG